MKKKVSQLSEEGRKGRKREGKERRTLCPELSEKALLFDEFRMRSRFNDLSVRENKDDVGVDDGRKSEDETSEETGSANEGKMRRKRNSPMSDGERGSVLKKEVESDLDLSFGVCVQS